MHLSKQYKIMLKCQKTCLIFLSVVVYLQSHITEVYQHKHWFSVQIIPWRILFIYLLTWCQGKIHNESYRNDNFNLFIYLQIYHGEYYYLLMYLHHVTAKYIIKMIAKTTFFFVQIIPWRIFISCFIYYLHHVTAKYIMNVIVETTFI